MLELATAYQIYPRVSKVPATFTDEQLRLSILCLLSFKQTLYEIQSIFDSYGNKYDDGHLRPSLTQQTHLLNLQVHWNTLDRRKPWLKPWAWSCEQILFKCKTGSWHATTPNLVIHIESLCPISVIDWYEEFDSRLKEALVAAAQLLQEIVAK